MKSRWLAKGTSAVAMIAVMGTATICPPPAHAGVPGVFATEYTQLLNYAELVGQLEKQVSMVENQLTQISDMTKQGLRSPTNSSGPWLQISQTCDRS